MLCQIDRVSPAVNHGIPAVRHKLRAAILDPFNEMMAVDHNARVSWRTQSECRSFQIADRLLSLEREVCLSIGVSIQTNYVFLSSFSRFIFELLSQLWPESQWHFDGVHAEQPRPDSC